MLWLVQYCVLRLFIHTFLYRVFKKMWIVFWPEICLLLPNVLQCSKKNWLLSRRPITLLIVSGHHLTISSRTWCGTQDIGCLVQGDSLFCPWSVTTKQNEILYIINLIQIRYLKLLKPKWNSIWIQTILKKTWVLLFKLYGLNFLINKGYNKRKLIKLYFLLQNLLDLPYLHYFFLFFFPGIP